MEFLRDKKLKNGVHLSFYNESRPVAGDRWLVVLKIVYTLPLSEIMVMEIEKCEDSKYYLDKFSDGLSLEIERKKHFVDALLVEDTLEELMSLAELNLMEYFSRQNFADRLFLKQIDLLNKEYLLQKQIQQNSALDDFVDEPADFSACFK